MQTPFPLTDDEIKEYQARMKELWGEELSFEDAKARLRQLLHLYWIFAHRPPKPAESRTVRLLHHGCDLSDIRDNLNELRIIAQ